MIASCNGNVDRRSLRERINVKKKREERDRRAIRICHNTLIKHARASSRSLNSLTRLASSRASARNGKQLHERENGRLVLDTVTKNVRLNLCS